MTQPDSQFVGALFLVTELMVDNTPVSIMVSVPTQDQVLYTRYRLYPYTAYATIYHSYLPSFP